MFNPQNILGAFLWILLMIFSAIVIQSIFYGIYLVLKKFFGELVGLILTLMIVIVMLLLGVLYMHSIHFPQ